MGARLAPTALPEMKPRRVSACWMARLIRLHILFPLESLIRWQMRGAIGSMKLPEVAALPYSIMLLARARTCGGIAIPSSLAVLELTVRKVFSEPSTGRSAGFAPLRIFPM